jgi:two-component system sensor histidine kinase TctE
MMNSLSLRFRLIANLGVALALIGLIGTLVAYTLGSNYANLAYDAGLFDDVSTLADQVAVGKDGAIEVNLPAAALKWLLSDEGETVHYRVTDMRDGTVVMSNGGLGGLPRASPKSGQASFRSISSGGRDMRVGYTVRIVDPDDIPVLVEVGETTGKRDRMAREILVGTVAFMSTIILVAVAVVWRSVSRALMPLKSLEEEVTRRSGADLMPLSPEKAPEEVRGLIEAVNHMMGRVSSVMASQDRFIANAAHQLRTPLAGIRLQAQLAAKAAHSEELRSSLREVQGSAERAAHLVDQLLVLSRAEAAGPRGGDQQVDLGRVAQEVIERYLPEADKRGVDLGYEGGSGSLLVSGNATLFEELVANLIDNALRYGRPGGRVTVQVNDESGNVLLAVSDEGDGFPEVERERVFERFYRGDSSSDSSGAGLGLAIVREIADRYHGRLRLVSARGKGSRFELDFPSALPV